MFSPTMVADFFAYTDKTTAKYVLDGAAAVAAALAPTAATMLSLYIVFWGLSMMTGKINEPVMDGAVRVLKASLIIAFATSSALYASNVVGFLYNWPAALVGIVGGSGVTNTTVILDNSFNQAITLGSQAWEKAGPMNMGLYIVALVIWAMGAVVTSIATVIIFTSKFCLAMLLAIGPFFILSLMFEATRSFFSKWLSMVVTQGFTIVLISMAVQLVIKYYAAGLAAGNADADDSGGIVSMTAMMPSIFISLVAIPLMRHIPHLAGGLGGGFSGGSTQIAGFALANRVAKGTAKAIGSSAVAGAKSAYQKLKNRGGFEAGGNKGGSLQGAPSAVYRKITSSSSRNPPQ